MIDHENGKPVSVQEFEARRRGRNLAIGLSLLAFVVLIFVITIVRLGPNVLDQPL